MTASPYKETSLINARSMEDRKDSQRSKVYAAERAAFGYRRFYHGGKTKAEILDYLQMLLDTKWLRKRWPNAPTVVQETMDQSTAYARKRSPIKGADKVLKVAWRRGSGASASPGRSLITFGASGDCLSYEITVHELAHILAPIHAKHNRIFCKVYVMLAERFFGIDDARALRREFVKRGVKHTLPKTLSTEAKAKAKVRGEALQRLRNKKDGGTFI